jgi:hypothetical protein
MHILGWGEASSWICLAGKEIVEALTVTAKSGLVALPKFFDGVTVGRPVASVQVLTVLHF